MLRDVRSLPIADELVFVRFLLLGRNNLCPRRVGIAVVFLFRRVRKRRTPACILARGLSVTILPLRWLDCPPLPVWLESPTLIAVPPRV